MQVKNHLKMNFSLFDEQVKSQNTIPVCQM